MSYTREQNALWQREGKYKDWVHPRDAFADLPLSEEEKADYMYMYSRDGKHFFKHRDTREYLTVFRPHRNKR
jgi:hypothetical protein